jgi:putative FmdB family regulatory protein
MPIYEFACQGCQHEFEMLVPSHRTKVACPRCQGGEVEKRFSAFAVRGSGGFVESRAAAAGMGGGGGGCCGGG